MDDDFAQHYHEEMAEFANMEDQIRDIDYYKAETEAARNGQLAAMEFANARGKEAAQARVDLEDYKKWIMGRIQLFGFSMIGVVLIVSLIAFEIGRWTS